MIPVDLSEMAEFIAVVQNRFVFLTCISRRCFSNVFSICFDGLGSLMAESMEIFLLVGNTSRFGLAGSLKMCDRSVRAFRDFYVCDQQCVCVCVQWVLESASEAVRSFHGFLLTLRGVNFNLWVSGLAAGSLRWEASKQQRFCYVMLVGLPPKRGQDNKT